MTGVQTCALPICIPYALILEDDAYLCEEFRKAAYPLLPLLEGREPMAILLTPGFIYRPGSGASYGAGEAQQLYPVRRGHMTSGYLINRAGARLLAERLKPVRYLADDWEEFVRMGLQLYGIVPHLISYPDEPGEIGRSQITPRRGMIKKLKKPFSILKSRLTFFLETTLRGEKRASRRW